MRLERLYSSMVQSKGISPGGDIVVAAILLSDVSTQAAGGTLSTPDPELLQHDPDLPRRSSSETAPIGSLDARGADQSKAELIRSRGARWRALQTRALRAGLPLLIVLALGASFHRDGAFFAWATHRAVLREIAVQGILACGMTVVIVAGGIDLSVGSVLSLCAVGAALLSMHFGWAAGTTLLAVLGIGALCGLISGLLVAWARIQAFVVTLAMMVFARGLAKHWSGGQKVSTYFQAADGRFVSVPMPAMFEWFDARFGGGHVAVVSLMLLLCAASTWLVLSHTSMGRYLYALGGNSEAARLSGVPVRATQVFAFTWMGLLAAVAGICQAAQETHGDPETGAGYELDAIAMVVLGGTSLAGGSGGVGLTLIGALTLGYLHKILSLNAYSTELRLMLTGTILIGAVLFQRRMSERAR